MTAHFLLSAQLSCLTVTLVLMKGQVVTDGTVAAIVPLQATVMSAVLASALKAKAEHQGSYYVMVCPCSDLDNYWILGPAGQLWGCCN